MNTTNNAAALERLIAELIDNAYSDGVDGTPCMSEQTERAKEALLRTLTQPEATNRNDLIRRLEIANSQLIGSVDSHNAIMDAIRALTNAEQSQRGGDVVAVVGADNDGDMRIDALVPLAIGTNLIIQPDALTSQPSGGGDEETEQSIAADCYHWIADCIGTLPGYSVQEHVEIMKETLKACSDFLHDFVPSSEGGSDEAVALAKNVRLVLSGRIDQYEALTHPPADAPGVAVDEWLPIETAPAGVPILVRYVNSAGKERVIKARFIQRFTEESSSDCDEGVDEYDEANDRYTYCEGWWEMIDNWDDFAFVAVSEGSPTHWHKIPSTAALAPKPEGEL